MLPARIELPVDLPRDLRREIVGLLEQLGPVQEVPARSFDLGVVVLVLAAISATADILAVADLIIAWREKARQRGARVEKATIVAGGTRVTLTNADAGTLVRVLEALREGRE